MKTNNLNSALLLLGFIGMSLSANSQENPWNKKTTNVNPWGNTENEEILESKKIDSVAIISNTILPSENLQEMAISNEVIADTSNLVLSKDSSAINESLSLNSNIKTHHKSIEELTKDYHAPLVVGSSIFSCVFLNFIAFPFNLISAGAKSKDEEEIISAYKSDNPECTEYDVNKLKSKIRGKRVGKALGGSLIGIVVNSIVLLLVFG